MSSAPSGISPKAAAELLGVPLGCDRDVLRRAYLRAVKAHPPERDPARFQELRAAYELLERFVGRTELKSSAASSPDVGAAPPELTSAEDAGVGAASPLHAHRPQPEDGLVALASAAWRSMSDAKWRKAARQLRKLVARMDEVPGLSFPLIAATVDIELGLLRRGKPDSQRAAAALHAAVSDALARGAPREPRSVAPFLLLDELHSGSFGAAEAAAVANAIAGRGSARRLLRVPVDPDRQPGLASLRNRFVGASPAPMADARPRTRFPWMFTAGVIAAMLGVVVGAAVLEPIRDRLPSESAFGSPEPARATTPDGVKAARGAAARIFERGMEAALAGRCDVAESQLRAYSLIADGNPAPDVDAEREARLSAAIADCRHPPAP